MEDRNTVRKWRHAPIFALLLVLIGVTLFLLPSDPLIAYRLHLLGHPGEVVAHQQFDPDAQARFDIPLGSPFPADGVGKQMRAHIPYCNRGYLIICLGDCASCIHFDFRLWQQQADALHLPLIGFSGATPAHIAAYKRAMKVTIPIYFDENNALSRSLNSYWNGRVYYYDKDWRLAWRMQGFGNDRDLNQQPGLRDLIGG